MATAVAKFILFVVFDGDNVDRSVIGRSLVNVLLISREAIASVVCVLSVADVVVAESGRGILIAIREA